MIFKIRIDSFRLPSAFDHALVPALVAHSHRALTAFLHASSSLEIASQEIHAADS
jgi:hypothetical protein